MNSSGISSNKLSFRDDNQDIEEMVATIDATNPFVDIDPKNNYDLALLRNTGELTILVTMIISKGKGANQTQIFRKLLLEEREVRVIDYSADVVDGLRLQELDPATIVPVAGLAMVDDFDALASPTGSASVRVTFLNS